MLYRGMDRAALDAAYNNAAAVADTPRYRAEWAARSAAIRARPGARLDIAFGAAPRAKLDLLMMDAPRRPTFAFIHGGYWQMNQKENFAFIVDGVHAAGLNLALLGYTLAPDVGMDEIVAEIRVGIAWLLDHLAAEGGDARALYVGGWSAGGHLAAMAMEEEGVRGGLAISGIYDLEPIRRNYLNEKLGLDRAAALRNSPLHRIPERAGRLVVTVGGAELPELQRQSRDYFAAWSAHGLPADFVAMPGHDHFTVMEDLARPGGRLGAALHQLVADTAR
jgi:arylformamidase